MNKRIKELAEQAGLEGDNGHYEYDWFNPEKFAELIVRECAMFLVTELEGKVGSRIADATANKLEEHFGVEE